MTDALFFLLLDRLALAASRRALNARVRDASEGRPHHQACRLGGIFTGMPADMSGSPCWCGEQDMDDWSIAALQARPGRDALRG